MLLKCVYFFCSRWRPPKYFRQYPESKFEKIRKKYHILVEGDDVPLPIKTFKVLCFEILLYLSRDLKRCYDSLFCFLLVNNFEYIIISIYFVTKYGI